MAKCVWALGDEEVLEHVISNRSEGPKLWLFWVLLTMWAFWWARRLAIHDEEFQSPLSTMSFINKYLEEREIANFLASRLQVSPVKRLKTRRWTTPVEDAAKANVDGGISHLRDKGDA